jgi:glycolate oxidase FAD binding subunit
MSGTVASPSDEGVVDERGVVDAVRAARAEGRSLRIVGRGTWLDAGRPVSAATTLGLAGLAGIMEYVPGDLTLTAYAGTTLEEIAMATAEHDQWLPLDAFGSPSGTLGATLATASAGPLAASIGVPRDVALGISFVSGDGSVVRGGGRVVKNVAGFDLVRLTVGAWGTTGAIVGATVRLRARPEADETVAVPLPDDRQALTTLLARVRSAGLASLAAELVSAGLSRLLDLAATDHLLLRLAGNAPSVRAQLREAAALGAGAQLPPDVWRRLRGAEPGTAIVVRRSARPSDMPSLWLNAVALASAAGGEAHASLERGVTRCWFPPLPTDALTASLGAREDGVHQVFERLPSVLWPRLAPSPVTDRLSRNVRAAFDPARLFNPGIFGEEQV